MDPAEAFINGIKKRIRKPTVRNIFLLIASPSHIPRILQAGSSDEIAAKHSGRPVFANRPRLLVRSFRELAYIASMINVGASPYDLPVDLSDPLACTIMQVLIMIG